MRRTSSLAFCCALAFAAGNAGAIEFDQRAGKMGLKGLAWDTTFTVYASDHDLAKETLNRIQDSYAAILGQLSQKLLRKKCLVFVWRDRAQFILHASMFSSGNDIVHAGAFVVRNFWGDCHALFTSQQDELYDRILPHELAHLVFPLFLGSERIPLWLNEGFAQCQEEGSFDEALAVVNGEVKKGKQYTLAALTRLKDYPSPHERNVLFYGQSELLVRLRAVDFSCGRYRAGYPRLQAVQLLYDGLYVVIARGSALCIVATPPCKARVCGVAVGDSRGEVMRVLGNPDSPLYGGKVLAYYTRVGKVKVSLSMDDGRVAQIKAFRTEFQGMKLRF